MVFGRFEVRALMSCLQTLRTTRLARLVVLLGYLLVVASTLTAPWLQPAAMGSVCSAGALGTTSGGDGEPSASIGCALCLPSAAPPNTCAANLFARQRPEAWRGLLHHTLTDPQPVAMPPARGPPAV